MAVRRALPWSHTSKHVSLPFKVLSPRERHPCMLALPPPLLHGCPFSSFLRVTILRLVVRESWRKGKKPSFMANSAHGVRTDRDLNMRIECVQCDHVTCSHSVPSVCAKRFPIWQRAKLVNVAIFSSVTFTLARTTLSALYVNASWKGIPIHVTCHVTDSFTITSVLSI